MDTIDLIMIVEYCRVNADNVITGDMHHTYYIKNCMVSIGFHGVHVGTNYNYSTDSPIGEYILMVEVFSYYTFLKEIKKYYAE